ncbi:MAG: hypothetical protein WCE64_11775 [Bacteroidales bacterium]
MRSSKVGFIAIIDSYSLGYWPFDPMPVYEKDNQFRIYPLPFPELLWEVIFLT